MEVTLPIQNFPAQQEIFSHPARFKIAVKGRRFGITRGAANDYILSALQGTFTRGLWVDTVNTNIDRYIERYFLPHLNKLPRHLWDWRKQDKILIINKSYIDFRSADRPENIEGFGYDKFFINEAGIVLKDEYLWSNAIRPMLWDYSAKGVIGGCIAEDSLVLEDGVKTIGSFSQERGINQYVPINKKIVGFGENEATDFYSNGVAEVCKIKTMGGYSLTGTPNHRVWTGSGWKMIKDLTKEDDIGIFYGQNKWGELDINFKYESNKHFRHLNPVLNEDTAYLMGYILGDGSISHKRITVNFHSEDLEIIDFLKKFNFKFSPKRDDQMRLNSREYVEFFRTLGMNQLTARNKVFPEKIMQCRKEIVREFLKGLFDADGCARQTGNVTFASTSEKLIKQVMVLLLNFGIISSYSAGHAPAHESIKGHISASILYTIHLNKYNSNLFGKVIGFRLSRKQSKITKSVTDRYLSGRKEGLIFWTNLAKKERDIAYTCDFVIPNTHSYISNGFMSHNTPKGLGVFKELFERGEDPSQEMYKSFRFTTFDNPYMPVDIIKKEMMDMPERVVRQEIYAEFLDDSGVVFRNVSDICTLEPKEPQGGHIYVIGADLAKVQDYTVLTVYDRRNNNQVYQDRFNKLDWNFQKKKIKALSEAYNRALVVVDATGVGDPIFEDLQRDGVPVEPFKFTNTSKKELVEKLSIWIEQKKMLMLKDEQTIREFNNFTYDIGTSGKIRYNAPRGFTDDVVMAHGLAVWQLNEVAKPDRPEELTPIQEHFRRKTSGEGEWLDPFADYY